MNLEEFRAALDARGGEAEVWVVCIEDANETRMAGHRTSERTERASLAPGAGHGAPARAPAGGSGGEAPRMRLVPRAAFWTRGEAYSFAYARHAAVAWHHAHVFRAWVDAAWVETGVPRALTFETVFTAATGEPHATLSPRALAALFGA